MRIPSKATRHPGVFSRVGAHLSFANVTASLALFVALGGSSYAAMRVGSQDIVNNSVSSQDLRNNDVRGPDIRKGTVRGTDVRDGDLTGKDVRNDTIGGVDVRESRLGTVPAAKNAETLGGKSASAFLGSDHQTRTGLIKLAHGDSRTIASSGPFTWKATCSDLGAGITRLIVTVETTEANSFAGTSAPAASRSPPARRPRSWIRPRRGRSTQSASRSLPSHRAAPRPPGWHSPASACSEPTA